MKEQECNRTDRCVIYCIDGQVWCTITCNINESNEVKIKEQIKFISKGGDHKDDDHNNAQNEANCATDVEDEDGSHSSLPEDEEELEVDDDCKIITYNNITINTTSYKTVSSLGFKVINKKLLNYSLGSFDRF